MLATERSRASQRAAYAPLAVEVHDLTNYHQDYLMGGMFGMALTDTAVGVSTDMATGLFDRFRSLPIARSAPLPVREISRPGRCNTLNCPQSSGRPH